MTEELQKIKRDDLFAEWTKKIPESEIRRLLRNMTKYYFAGGLPGLLPLDVFSKIFSDLSEQIAAEIKTNEGYKKMLTFFNYGPTEGLPTLRKTLAKRMVQREHLPLNPEEDWKNVIITTGSQQFLYLVLNVLINPGDVVLCTRPTYLGFVGPASILDARVITIPTDTDGIIPEYLEKAIDLSIKEFGKKPKLLYIIAYSDNPKGTTLPMKRKEAIWDIAETYDILILEDEAYKEMQFDRKPIYPLKAFDKENKRVIYGTSTSKEAAVFRLGYTYMPPAIGEQVIKAKGYQDLCTPSLTQELTRIYYENYIDDALKHIVGQYEERGKTMLRAIAEYMPENGIYTKPTGGFFVWWEDAANPEFNTKEFLEKVAIPNDLMYVPGQAFYPISGFDYLPERNELIKTRPATNGMRLSFSLLPPEDIEEGIKRLGTLLRQR